MPKDVKYAHLSLTQKKEKGKYCYWYNTINSMHCLIQKAVKEKSKDHAVTIKSRTPVSLILPEGRKVLIVAFFIVRIWTDTLFFEI
jgi:hypothetical protein